MTVPVGRLGVGRHLTAARPGRRSGDARLLGMGPAIAVSLVPGTLLFLVFFAIPLVVLVATAFTEWTGRRLEPVGIANFEGVVADPVFWKAVGNTLFYAAVGVFVQVPLGCLVGIVIARRPRGWRALRAIVFLPYMISGAAGALVFTVVYNPRFGLLNALLERLGLPADTDWLFTGSTARWAVAATFAFTIGFAAVVVSAEIASFPAEIYEAAAIDGAGVLQQQLLLTVPLLRNVVGTLVLLAILGNLAAFDIVYILTNGGPADGTATLILYAYRAYLSGDWGLANAVGVIVVVLGLVLIIGVRRLFRIGEER